VIGRDARNVSLEDAPQYIGAYTCGNDVSSRKWQMDPKLAGSVPQWSYSKSFDTYAPLGPCLVSADLINPKDLHLTTKVNGEERQSSGVNDLLFDCAYLIHFFSQGQTLETGTVFMTGTPGGKSLHSL
jgi:2-keto-4-pentenoate hydratase/2-oxohepta-3-ene-1,7-dioic acid hydratase in catechol pathway